MKKIIFALAVILLAAPAWASVDVNCTCDGDEVTVIFDARSETDPNVRAFALDITVDSGAKITGASNFSSDFTIYPGSIDINGTTGNVDYAGSPICDAGVYDDTLAGPPDSNGMTIEMGSLYEKGVDPSPDPCGVLLKFTVDATCTVSFAGNVSRAGSNGVVMEDPCATPVVNFGTCGTLVCVVPNVVDIAQADANAAIIAADFTVGNITTDCNETIAAGNVISSDPAAGATPGCGTAVDIVVSTGSCECYAGQPDYDEWEAVGKPICWCFDRQCHGDGDGYVQGKYLDTWVGTDDLAVLKGTWFRTYPEMILPGGDPCTVYIAAIDANVPMICADFNRDAEGKYDDIRVGIADLGILKKAWFITDTGDPNYPDPNCVPGNETPPW